MKYSLLILLLISTFSFSESKYRLFFSGNSEIAFSDPLETGSGLGFTIEQVRKDVFYFLSYSGNFLNSSVKLEDDFNKVYYNLKGEGSVHRFAVGSGFQIPSKSRISYEFTGEIGAELMKSYYSGSLDIGYDSLYNLYHETNFIVKNADIAYNSVYFALAFRLNYLISESISFCCGPKIYLFSDIKEDLKFTLSENDGFNKDTEIELPIQYNPIFLDLFAGFVWSL